MSDFKITAAILAGAPPEANSHPILAEIIDKTLFQYLISQLVKVEIDRIVICTTPAIAEIMKEKYGSAYEGAELIYSCESSPLGTGGALVNALSYFQTDDIMVLNGDAYIACNLLNFTEWYFDTPRFDAGMLLADVENAENFGRVRFYDDNMIYHFEEKGKTPGPGLVNAGIYMLRTDLLDLLPKDSPSSLESNLFPALVKDRRLYCLPTLGKFIEAESPSAEWVIRSHYPRDIFG
jgi:D-glycero-alpha-D-manno-heptose 1-phosphate guanylyltransferase